MSTSTAPATISAPSTSGAGAPAAPAPAATPGAAPAADVGGSPESKGPSAEAPKVLEKHVVHDLFAKGTSPQQPFDPSKFGSVAEYHQGHEAYQRQAKFRTEMRDAMTSPLTVGGVTIAGFTSESQVNEFLRFAGQKYQNITPTDLLMLYRMKEMISLAESSGSRNAQKQIERGTPAPQKVTTSQAAPKQVQSDDAPFMNQNGSVMSSRAMYKHLFPNEDPSKITQG